MLVFNLPLVRRNCRHRHAVENHPYGATADGAGEFDVITAVAPRFHGAGSGKMLNVVYGGLGRSKQTAWC